jgi:hypothetical protein
MDKKKSIINIQDLGLSAANQHSIGGQPILWLIFGRKFFLISRSKIFYFGKFSIFRKFFQDIGEQPIP